MKKIDPQKLSKIGKNKNPEEIEKASGGKVITKILSNEEEDKRKKDTYVKYTDHSKAVHTKHGKTI